MKIKVNVLQSTENASTFYFEYESDFIPDIGDNFVAENNDVYIDHCQVLRREFRIYDVPEVVLTVGEV